MEKTQERRELTNTITSARRDRCSGSSDTASEGGATSVTTSHPHYTDNEAGNVAETMKSFAMSDTRHEPRSVNWGRYGLNQDSRDTTPNSPEGGDFGYGPGGHIPLDRTELFAEELGSKPWWKSNFFISEPVLFGQWDGVFTSCLINIFGVIVFLRAGWMVAEAGILNAILIIVATVSVALISVLSAIGICERCRMESGGVYFLLSHVLGSRFGGAIGLIYCFGQAVGCALNVLGFGESIAGLLGFGSSSWAVKGFAGLAVVLLSVINLAGVKWVVKLQFALLLVLLSAGLDFAVGSFIHTNIRAGFTGWHTANWEENLYAKYMNGYSWFTVFGVFFPTVTGVMAGINMSGDLRAPSRDIPNGSLAAVSVGTFLYLVFVLILGATCTRDALRSNFMIAEEVSAISVLLLAGLYVSSMSSCLAAMYGTPRVLQSIANQDVVPFIAVLGKGRGPNKVPLYAMAVVAVVTLTFILVGDINLLAPIVTMPFLLTYASIDYSYFALAQTFDVQLNNEQRFRYKSPPSSQDNVEYSGPYQNGETRNIRRRTESFDDLDYLFPERTQHKTKQVAAAGNPNESFGTSRDALVHSKPLSWYSSLCNRWFSLLGAVIKIVIMLLVDWMYAMAFITIVALVWFYVGAANPAVKPGLANQFRFLPWMKSVCLRAAGRKGGELEHMVIPPANPVVDTHADQINEDNQDFSERQRYHQSQTLTASLVDIDSD